MRYGFTTGSCAAAAAKAAAYMLLSGREKKEITIQTPGGIAFTARLRQICREEGEVSCGVEKDGGDDPDVTTGALICARVCLGSGKGQKVQIEGGAGVGRVTRPGLDQPVGSPAINRVPREMIRREVLEVCEAFDCQEGLTVEIFVPEGERLAERTFNPRLGIRGGISILGTTGIVEPMSSRAILDTMRVELRQRRAEGERCAIVSPGNYGQAFVRQTYGYDLDKSVKCSNFIGDAVDMAAELGFEKFLLVGHIGKLVKVSGGILNTHSREGDCRMELLAAAGIRQGVEPAALRRILDCVTTEEALDVLEESGRRREVMEDCLEHICFYLDRRAQGKLETACVLYANGYGELAKSKEAAEWFTLSAQGQEPST